MKRKWKDAFPPVDDSFERSMDRAFEVIRKENRKVKKKISTGFLLAAVMMLVSVGVAVAARQSHLLAYIFRGSTESPTPAAEAHLVQLDEGKTTENVSFHVNEYLLDDDTLYLSWTAENHTGEPLIFFGPFIEGAGKYEFIGGMLMRTAVGGEVMGVALPEACSQTSEYHVTGDGEGPVKVTMLVQKPVAEFVDSRTSSPVGTPVIVWNADLKQVESFCFGYTVGPAKTVRDGELVDDDSSDGFGTWTSALYNYDDRDEPQGVDFLALEGMLWQVQEDERLGYVELVDRWDVDVTLEMGATRRSLARELPRFECDGYDVVVTELTQTDLMNRLQFQVVPKQEGAFDDGIPEFRLFVNGASEEPRSLVSQGTILNDGWTFSNAMPVDDTPRISAEEFEWLNDGEPLKEIRLVPVGNSDAYIIWRL